MMKSLENNMQRYTTPKDPFAAPEINTPLPIEKPIAIYYRQSALFQVGNISTSMQTVDMVEYLSRLGWARDHIMLIDMDEGMSGSKKIDERPDMRLLFSLITQGKIGAVACQDEDRLFRDVTQIQVNVFIEACRAHNVRVLTPTVFYDFAHPLVGTFHMRQFRFKSEMAAEYIDTYVRKRLVGARRRLLYEGRWTGSNTPRGYMVDLRE
jgi:DNA invertase Pin-like site-specific DNA recombinase